MASDDIVERLRNCDCIFCLCFEASNEIERLRAENATLRKQLDQFVGQFNDEVQREAL